MDKKTSALREYVAAVLRRKWLIIGAVAVATVLAAVVSFSRTPLYTATATIAYQKQTDMSSALGASAYVSPVDVERELTTSATLIGQVDLANRVKAVYDTPLSAVALSHKVVATAPTDTNILDISVTSTSPQEASAIANAYALAFTQWKKQQTLQGLQRAMDYVNARLLAKYGTPAQKAADLPGWYALTGRLEDIKVSEAIATGNYVIVGVASPPTHPSSPNHQLDILFGFALGLLGGIVLAFFAEQMDVRVRNQDDIVDVVNLPILGRIPKPSRAVMRNDALAVLAEPDGSMAEAFRMLRGSLDFVNVDANVRSIVVTSPSSGEGKSSTVCNLAVTLARAGKRVAVVEADLRRPKVHRYFGLDNEVGISDVLTGKRALADAVTVLDVAPDQGRLESDSADDGEHAATLRVLTAGPLPPNPGEIVVSRRLGEIVAELAADADIVLVDSPPFLAVSDAASLAGLVDGIVLIVKIGKVTRSMVREAKDFLQTVPSRPLGVVVTNAAAETRGVYRQGYYERPLKRWGFKIVSGHGSRAKEPVDTDTEV